LTGFEWPQILTRNQIITQKPYGTDVKTIWEIARFQFLSPLAQAYIITGEEEYARFAIDKVDSWIKENHFPCGPHWTVAMESSIRLINWCVYLPLLDLFKYADLSFKNKITQSILEHIIYIRENLEVSPSGANNHYLADLVGLLLARFLFPSISWAVETSEFAEREFVREVQRQFTPSGINFEGSLPYHRLSSEICMIGVAIIKKSGKDVPESIIRRLREISNFTRYYSDACEECPTIGDNDSGVFVKFFHGQELNRHKYLDFLFGCILDDRNDPQNWDEFLCGIHFTNTNRPSITDNRKLIKNQNNGIEVKEFDGLVISRKGNESLFFNTIRSSEGHTHNDKLSIYPVFGSKLLFVDRGTFSYTGFTEKRHEDRMTSSHNGPVINGWEQSRIWKEDPFYINGDAKCDNRIDSSGNVVTITGWHDGYRRYSPGMKVFRRVKWDNTNRTMEVIDWVEGEKIANDVRFTWYFLINPIWIGLNKNGNFEFNNEGQTVHFEDIDEIGFTLTRGLYCSSYQVEASCQALKASRIAAVDEKTRFLVSY